MQINGHDVVPSHAWKTRDGRYVRIMDIRPGGANPVLCYCGRTYDAQGVLFETTVITANPDRLLRPVNAKDGVPVSFTDCRHVDDAREHTGGSVSYYKIEVTNPTSGGEPYTAECNDIIEALNLNFAEGNALKAIWRSAAARLGKSKRGYDDQVYDAEKVAFFGQRMVEQTKSKPHLGGA